MNKFKLLIDIHNKKVIDGTTNLSVQRHAMTVSLDDVTSTLEKNSKYATPLQQYRNLTISNRTSSKFKHDVEHYFTTLEQLAYCKARKLDSKRLRK